MTIKEIHDLFNLLADKQGTAYFSHEDIDNFLDMANKWGIAEYRRVYGIGVDNHECMAPFVCRWEFGVSEDIEDGVIEIPTSERFMRLSVINLMSSSDDGAVCQEVEIIAHTVLADRLRSELIPVSQYPIATVEGNGKWRIYPKQECAGFVQFIQSPAKPFYKYTMDGAVEIHDAANSVNLQWSDGYVNRILWKALTLAGFTLDSNWMVEAGMAMEKIKP